MKTQKNTEVQVQEFVIEEATAEDITISGRGRGRSRSALFLACESMPEGTKIRTQNLPVPTVNNCVHALNAAHPDRKYASRARGSLIVRLS